MSLSVVDLFISRLDVPFSPWSYDLHARGPSLDREFESYLIVALACAAVADSVSAFLESDLCEFLADDRSCKSCAEHISLILSSHLDRWNDDFFYHLICKVCNDQLACSCLESLFLKSLELISLSYVAADCDDLRIVVVLLEPWNDDGSVETS